MGPQLLRCVCVGEGRGAVHLGVLLIGFCRDIVEGRRDIDVEQWKKWCDNTNDGSDNVRLHDEAPAPDFCPPLSSGPVTTRTISLSDGSCASARHTEILQQFKRSVLEVKMCNMCLQVLGPSG